jgi:hypothetical protein
VIRPPVLRDTGTEDEGRVERVRDLVDAIAHFCAVGDEELGALLDWRESSQAVTPVLATARQDMWQEWSLWLWFRIMVV